MKRSWLLLIFTLVLCACALPTLIEQKVTEAPPPTGGSLFVINPSTTSIKNYGLIKTLWLRWDPRVEMAISEDEIEKALAKRRRLASSAETADVIVKLVFPRPESVGVSEEVELIRRSSGRVIANLNKKSDSWDQAVQALLDWVDGVKPQQDGRE